MLLVCLLMPASLKEKCMKGNNKEDILINIMGSR